MVIIKKTWEEIYFTASKKGIGSSTIKVSLNHDTKKYQICTTREESVSFNDDDTIEISKLKLKALTQAIKYIEQQLNNN